MKHDLLTAAEAGQVLRTSGAAVRALIRRGRLKGDLYGNRWLIKRSELQKIQDQRKKNLTPLLQKRNMA